jgi:hypothetical protein
MNKLLLLLALILAPCVVPAQAASANPAAQRSLWNLKSLREKLDLSSDQVARIKTEFAQHKDALRSASAKLREARGELRTAIQNNVPEPQLRAAAANVGTAEGDLAVVRAALFAGIKPILTSDQLAKLQALQTARR